MRSHLVVRVKEYLEFRYTLFIIGIFTECSFPEFYGFDHENLKVMVYGKPDAQVGMTSIPE